MATYSSPWDWYRAQGAATFSGVVAPAPTSDSKASGVALANKTFSSFTDPNGLIASYTAVTLNTTGSCSWSGSGLGPYTPTSADGDAGALGLQAKDSAGNVLAVALHSYDRAAGGGGGGGGGSLDPDADTPSLNTTNVSNATTGWVAGSVAFRGPTESSGATLGGPSAASFTLSGGANGTVQLAAATDLSDTGGPGGDGNYEVTVNVNNEGGAGYTTSTLTITVTPDTSDLLMLVTSDGYAYWRHAGGPWNVDQIWAGQNLMQPGLVEDGGTIFAITSRYDQTNNADTLQSSDIVTPTWTGTNIGGTLYAVQAEFCDPTSGWTFMSGNNGRVYGKLTASAIADGHMGGFSTFRMNSGGDWTGGSGWSFVSRIKSRPSDGRIIAVGYFGGSNTPCVSTNDGDPTQTWTQRTFGTWTTGNCYALAMNNSLAVAVGYSSTWGVLAWSSDGGETWDTTTAIASNTFRDVDVNNDGTLWVAVGHGGAIYTSTDPTSGTWTARTSGTANDLTCVRWDDGAQEWVAGGASGTLLSSADGVTWAAESYPAGTSGNFNYAECALTSAPA